MLLVACGGDVPDSTGAVPRFSSFTLEPSQVQLRPYQCQQVNLGVESEPSIDPADIRWSGDTRLSIEVTRLDPGTVVRSYAMVCAGGASGTFDFRAGLASLDGYFADGQVQVGLPASVDAAFGSKPVAAIYGEPHVRPSRISWAPDGESFFVAAHDGTLTQWDGRTVAYVDAWMTQSADATFVAPGQVVTVPFERDVALYDLRTRQHVTWLRQQGEELPARFARDIGETLDTSTIAAATGASGRLASWQAGADFCHVGTLDLATNTRVRLASIGGGVPQTNLATELGLDFGFGPTAGSFVPELFTEVSPRGRYVLFGPGGCPPIGDAVFDAETRTIADCGDFERRHFAHRAVFAPDESVLVAPTHTTIEVRELPSCAPRGSIPTAFGHQGLAVSPDGTTLALIGDLGPLDGNRREVMVALYDIALGAPVWTPNPHGTAQHSGHPTRVIRFDPGLVLDEVWEASAHRVAFSPDGRRLAFAVANGRLGVIDLDRPDDDAVTFDSQVPAYASLVEAKLAPNKRYLWMVTFARLGFRGFFDLEAHRVSYRFPANDSLVALRDLTFVVFRAGPGKYFEAPYDDPSAEMEIAEPPAPDPLPPETGDRCEIRSNEVCVILDGETRCVPAVATQTALVKRGCVVVVSGGKLFYWAAGTPDGAFAAYLAGGDADLTDALFKLDERTVLYVNRRLNLWRF